MKFLASLFVLVVATLNVLGQTGAVRGYIVDLQSGLPLVGANVIVDSTTTGAATDKNGEYEIPALQPGDYKLTVSYIGYVSAHLDVEIVADSTIIKHVTMSQGQPVVTPPVNIWGRQRLVVFVPHIPSRHNISVQETRRHAATFYDPARLAASLPGVNLANDQGNNLVIRGNGPNSLAWRLEGIDIVNPNHTANAGTLSDRPTRNGGGVNILSAQMLGNTSVLTGAFEAGYGNSIGGIMDMNFRNGNTKQKRHLVQAGLVGVDVATEGPLPSRRSASYLANYRYSFTGLLGLGGIDFDGEAIAFQDFSFNVYYQLRHGWIKVFGLGGMSTNRYETVRDSTQWEVDKQRQDIDFQSKMGAMGISLRSTVRENYVVQTTVAVSGVEHQRQSWELNSNYKPVPATRDVLAERIVSGHSYVRRYIGYRTNVTAGVLLTNQHLRLLARDMGENTGQGRGNYLIAQPYLQSQQKWTERWNSTLGLHYLYEGISNSNLLEPRASVRFERRRHEFFNFAYGLHSQTHGQAVYFSPYPRNRQLKPTRSHHTVVGWNRKLNKQGWVRLESYYQRLFNIPVALDPASPFSILNLDESIVSEPLVNEGKGWNAGFEAMWQRSLPSKFYGAEWYWLLSTSIYDSRYTPLDGIERNTRYNGNFAVNASIGREWRWVQFFKERQLTINTRIFWLGGVRETPVDATVSEQQQTTVLDQSQAFGAQLPNFFRMDLRIMLRTKRETRFSSWALDIQNATNHQNAAFRYYDTTAGQVLLKHQLGLIPLLTWRLEF